MFGHVMGGKQKRGNWICLSLIESNQFTSHEHAVSGRTLRAEHRCTHHNSKLLRLRQICILIFILGQGIDLLLLRKVLHQVLQR